MEKTELTAFKGMVDGVRIKLAEDGRIFEIAQELEKKLVENKVFFGDGNCRIRFGGRRLSEGEKNRLEELVKRYLPLSRVEFESEIKKEQPKTDWISAYKEKAAKTEEESEDDIAQKVQDTANEEFVSVFRSNRARFYEGTVKDGMKLTSDGHLILLGSVEMGGELSAAGNIIVIGGLYGKAHAGCNGHNGSYIIAMDMRPEGLAISHTGELYEYPESEEQTEQVQSEAEPKKGIFDKLRKKEREDEPIANEEQTERPMIAELKNNKIELDKFSIQDFTNPKNMI